jgi:hypothetical protein
MAMAIEDFRKEFINDLRIEAGIHKTDTEDRFLENTFEMFREGEILSDPVRFYFGNNGRRNRMMQIYGYAYDEAESSLASGETSPYEYTEDKIIEMLESGKDFELKAPRVDIILCKDSTQYFELANSKKLTAIDTTLETEGKILSEYIHPLLFSLAK